MGNVIASSIPPLSDHQSSSSSNSSNNPYIPPTALPDDLLASFDSKKSLNNPGTIEELHRKCKDVFPVPFDGVKAIINKMLSNHFQISHNIAMNSASNGYRFGATYIGTKQISQSEAYPLFFGEIDPSGNLNSRIIHLVGDRTKVNLMAQFQNSKCVVQQLNADYFGPDYTASIALGNVDPVRNSGLMIASYLQNITNKFSIGTELVIQHSPEVSYSVLALVGRYTSPDNYIVSGNLSNHSVQMCFYRKTNQFSQVGVQLETNLAELDSSASFGYQIDLPKSNFVFRGFLDTNWNVGGVFEKKLLPLPLTLMFSGLINHVKSQTRLTKLN
ncbi:Mitochondrial import receptor subunit TOM40 -like protein 1 [Sarcoptes scabiei]|nr:Mitochondrial import receptor subunit TOM40 -like protein 1 [Sarcoptes scabiei]